MRLSVRHTTHYAFSQPVSHGLQRLRLRPKTSHGQHVKSWETDIVGGRREVEYDDQHNNHTMLISVDPGASAVTITCNGVVDTADNAGVMGQHIGFMPLWAYRNQTALTRPGPRMRALIAGLDCDRANPLEVLHSLSRAVLSAVRYEIGHTSVTTTAEEAVVAGHGVCQDHAHIFIGCARQLDIPARYVSGYLMMDDRIDQEAGHGWAEAFVEGLGWVGFDISNGICPDPRYIRVATGCDYRAAAPVTGISWGEGETELAVSLAVEQQVVEQ